MVNARLTRDMIHWIKTGETDDPLILLTQLDLRGWGMPLGMMVLVMGIMLWLNHRDRKRADGV